MDLGEESKLLDSERSRSKKSIESEIDSGGAMSVPAGSLPAVRSWLVFLRLDRNLTTVEKLEHE